MVKHQATSISQNLDRFGNTAYLLLARLIESRWVLIAVALIAAFNFFFRLGASSLQNWDEAIYAEVAKQMVESGEYLTQRFGDALRFEKPPLVPWTMAAFYNLFSINEFWSRAASATSGVFLSIIVYMIGRTVYAPQVGLVAVLTMLSMYEVTKRARFATTDTMLTLFVYVAVFAYLKLDDRKQYWWYVIWISFALAFMAKFWAALIIPASLVIALVIDGKIDTLRDSRQFWHGAFIAALIVLPWHIIMYIRHGWSFVDIYILRNLLVRSTTAIEGHVGGKFYYFQFLQRTFLPWFYLLPITVAIELKDNLLGNSRSRVLLIFTTLTIVLYSLVVATKIRVYILPVFPALALFIAYTIYRAYRDYRTIAFSGLLFVTFLATLIASNKVTVAYLVLIVPIAFLTMKFVGKIRSHQVAVLAMYGFLLVSSVMINVRGYHLPPLFAARQAPIVELGQLVGQFDPVSKAPIIGVALGQDIDLDTAIEGPAATFYSDRSIEVVYDLEDLSKFVREGEDREILVAEKYLDTLSETYEITVRANVDPLVYGVIKSRSS